MQFLRWGIALAALHFVLALLYARATPFLTPGFIMHERGTQRAFSLKSGEVIELRRVEVTEVTREGDGSARVRTVAGDNLEVAAPYEQVNAWWGHIIDVGAPDELQHVVYVKRMAAGEGFPVLDPQDPDLGRNYQSHQPPAYYLLAAGWSKLFGQGALGMRSLNAVIGAVTVLGVFFLAWWGTRREAIAVAAAAFAALLPMNVALSGAVSNDPLLFCLCTWALALTALYGRDGFCTKRGMLLGAIVGLAFLTKTTAVALVPAVVVGLILAPIRPGLATILPGSLLSLAMGGAWWIRNTRLYGDPFAIKAFNVAFQGSPKAEIFIQSFGSQSYWVEWVGWWTFRSFVGVFGYMDVFLPSQVYAIVGAGLGLVLILGLIKAFGKDAVAERGFHIMNLLFALTVLFLFMQFNKQYFQGQARYLLPALGPISVGIGLGICGFSSRRPLIPTAILAVTLLGLNGWVLSSLPNEFAVRTAQTLPASEASK